MTRRVSNACAAMLSLVALSFSAGEGRCQTTLTFVSDGSWQTFAMNPDGSQGASLGQPQFPSWAVHGANLSAIPGASWMWMPGVDALSPSDLQGAYFSKQFDLQGTPIAGQILIAVDDLAEVMVNGTSVGSTGSITDLSTAAGAQSSLRPFDLAPFLLPGVNRITIRAQNGPSSFTGGACSVCSYGRNPAGVVFGGSLSFDATTSAKRATWGGVKALYR